MNYKTMIPAVIGYMIINYIANGEYRGWEGVIGAAIFGGLAAAIFPDDSGKN